MARDEGILTPSQPSRRLFLGAGAASLAMFATEAFAVGQERLLTANEYAEAFPKKQELKHIADIRTDLREGAQHLLIHLRIQHWHDDHTSDEVIKETETCQTEWKAALESMIAHKRLKLRGIYAEGMTARGTQRLFSTPYDVDAEMAKHAVNIVPPRDGPAPAPEPPAKDWSHIPVLVRQGADYQLCDEGKVELYGIEWSDTQRLNTLASKHRWHDRQKYRDARERSALEIIAAEQERFAYVFYGAAHWWGDNIDLWNKERPDHVFSLMEVTTDWLHKNDIKGQQRIAKAA